MSTILLKNYVNPSQLSCLIRNCTGEEGEYFRDKLKKISALIEGMPRTYQQDGKGDKAIAYLHYFKGGYDWFIIERDIYTDELQAFGFAKLGGQGELGYICIPELLKYGVELDLYFSPVTLVELKRRFR